MTGVWDNRRKSYAAVAVVCALLSIHASCPRNNPDALVDRVAAYGARVGEILSESQDLVVTATPSLIPEDKTAKIQAQLNQAAQIGLKLTDALALYDALSPNDETARSAAIGNINNLIGELRKYTRVVLVFVGENPVGTQLLRLYDNLEEVFAQIQAGIDKWQLSAAQ